jgi:hypothetical protein
LAWALHGKEHAKAHIGKTDGDRLDAAIRASSGGQTIGIPIGPDSSFVAAEIVLTAIDISLQEQLPGLKGFRYLDDYEFAFRSRAEAEEALVTLEGALAEYELALNASKTRIFELPEPFEPRWPHEIRTFAIRSGTPIQTFNDVVALFNRAAELAQIDPGALKYAILKCRDVTIAPRHWRPFQHLVWSAVSAVPTTTASALDLLRIKSQEIEHPVDLEEAGHVLEGLILGNAPLRNSSEVVWAIWAATVFGIELSVAAAAAASRVEDDFVAIVALHGESSGTFPTGSVDYTAWEQAVTDDEALYGPHWLLKYENCVHSWFSGADADVSSDPFFSKLLAQGVSFFDAATERDPFTGPAGPLPGALVPDVYL